jgi:hypothetical protein
VLYIHTSTRPARAEGNARVGLLDVGGDDEFITRRRRKLPGRPDPAGGPLGAIAEDGDREAGSHGERCYDARA